MAVHEGLAKGRPLRVGEVMTRDPLTVDADATVEEAAKMMMQHACGSCLVEQRNAIVGIITERDIIRRAAANGLSLKETKVSAIMSTPITAVPPDISIEEAAKIMASKKVRRLPVVEKGTLVGVLSITDLAVPLLRKAELAQYLVQAITRRPPMYD